jgi:hypothetical protein
MNDIDFKIYYSDGSVYSGDVSECPIWEVLLIVEKDKEHGRKIVSGGDYYTYEDGRWISCDFITMLQYMARSGMYKRFLVGVMSSHEKWADAVRRARVDPDFPEQTALHKFESKDGF